MPRRVRTCLRIVSVQVSRVAAKSSLLSAKTRRRCSAESWIGVSGFLTSCATWRAISAQAARRLLRSRSRRCRSRSRAIWLKASTSRRSSSWLVASTRASRSPWAMRRVARVRSWMGPEMRRAMERASAAARARKTTEARRMVRSRSSTVASTSRWRRARGMERTPCSATADVGGHRGHQVREVADPLRLQRRGLAFQHDRAVDGAGDARGEEARRRRARACWRRAAVRARRGRGRSSPPRPATPARRR